MLFYIDLNKGLGRRFTKEGKIPVTRTVTRRGKTFTQTYWVRPEQKDYLDRKSKGEIREVKYAMTGAEAREYVKELRAKHGTNKLLVLAEENGLKWKRSPYHRGADYLAMQMKLIQHIRRGGQFHEEMGIPENAYISRMDPLDRIEKMSHNLRRRKAAASQIVANYYNNNPDAKNREIPVHIKVNEMIEKGIKSDVDISHIGETIDKHVTKSITTNNNLRELDDEIDRLKKIKDVQYEKMIQLMRDDPTSEAFKKLSREVGEMTEKLFQLKSKRLNITKEIGEQMAKSYLEVLSSIRPMGGKIQWKKGSSRESVRQLNKSLQFYPSDWVKIAEKIGNIKVGKVKRGFFTPYNQKGEAQINLSGGNEQELYETATHELGHLFETIIPGISEMETRHHQTRTKGQKVEHMGDGYGREEVTRPDEYGHRYMGKEYKPISMYGGLKYHEILTMGVEGIMHGKDYMRKDPRTRHFVLGLLATL